jgi:thymidylate synthase
MLSVDTCSGNVPVLTVKADCLPEAWEKAVLAVWNQGVEVRTEYDKPNDPPSRDATVVITVADPFAQPRIHKNFPGGPAELEAYRQEVCDGIHDHWIDPAGGKWTYTYHERLFAYCPVDDLSSAAPAKPFVPFDQIDYVVRKCSETFHTRRAQATTWMPTADPVTNDPPCLQRLWFRIIEDERARPVLNMNSHWRSRDLYKAWFMNAYALTDLQRIIAGRISRNIGREVLIGRYVDITDSLHIYGSYFNDIQLEIEKMSQGDWSSRAWSTDYPAFAAMTEEARQKLAQDPDYFAKGNQ